MNNLTCARKVRGSWRGRGGQEGETTNGTKRNCMAPHHEVLEAGVQPGGQKDNICFSHYKTMQNTVETSRQSREGTRGGGVAGGWAGGEEIIATVITNKNHLSHLCNLFSFNIRSMLKRSWSLSGDWEGQALGHSHSSPGLYQQEGIIFKPTCTLTLHWTHTGRGGRMTGNTWAWRFAWSPCNQHLNDTSTLPE